MIATILPNASTFAGIDYSEKKTVKNQAELMCVQNLGYLELLNLNSGSNYKQYMEDVCKKNPSVKNVQFHAIISCKGREYSKEELNNIAQQYLREMGYGSNPSLIYYHNDTANNHVHLITTRVGLDGKKIDDSFEKRRSWIAINKIMKNDVKQIAKDDFSRALKYNYSSFSQFIAILESKGYDCFMKDNSISIVKGGNVLLNKPVDLVKYYQERQKYVEDKKRVSQLKALFWKYKDVPDIDTFSKIMKDRFNIDIVLLGKPKSPYGYFVVDNSKKAVYKGSDIFSIKNLLDFAPNENRIKWCNEIIKFSLQEDPLISTYRINEILRKNKIKISGNHLISILTGEILCPLDKSINEKLRYNNKVYMCNQFNPVNEQEREILAKLYNVSPNHLHFNYSTKNINTSIYSDILDDVKSGEYGVYSELKERGLFLMKSERGSYLIDSTNHILISLNDMGYNDSLFESYYFSSSEDHSFKSMHEQSLFSSIFSGAGNTATAGGSINNELPKKKKKNRNI